MPTPILDIHCHPILKSYLFGTELNAEQTIGPEVDVQSVSTLYTSFPRLRAGGVFGIISYGYIPERRLKTTSKSFLMHPVWSLIQGVSQKTADKIEGGVGNTKDCFLQTTAMLREFEQTAVNAGATFAQDYRDVEQHFQAAAHHPAQLHHRPLMLHALEGGHHLGRFTPPNDDKQAQIAEYRRRIQELFQMGVAVLTIAHFFDNVLIASGGGFPPDIMAALQYPIQVLSDARGLSAIGGEVIKKMWELGIVLDLTHCPPAARKEIYHLHTTFGNDRPLIFSHTGVQAKFAEGILQSKPEHHGYAQHDALLLPSDDEIKRIAATGGVIGVICMQYWLKGYPEENTPRFLADPIPDNSLDAIIETIQHICAITGNSLHVSLGTDFDGFTDVPDDIPHAGFVQRIIEKLRTSTLNGRPVTEDDIENFAYKNALRVLKLGWGKKKEMPLV